MSGYVRRAELAHPTAPILGEESPVAQALRRFSPGDAVRALSGKSSIGFRSLGLLNFFLLTVATVLLLCLSAYNLRQRRRREMAAARRRAAVEEGLRLGRSPSRRYASVEAWLVSKPATQHDAVCDEAHLKLTSRASSSSLSTLDDSNVKPSSDLEEGNGECSICFEAFALNDFVSWSPNPVCNHAFHHGCIKEWLLQHDSCPSCRRTILPIDGGTFNSKTLIPELLVSKQHRAVPSFYCLEHGVVRPILHDSCSEQLCQRANHQYSRVELQRLRGHINAPGLNDDCDEEVACDDVEHQGNYESSASTTTASTTTTTTATINANTTGTDEEDDDDSADGTTNEEGRNCTRDDHDSEDSAGNTDDETAVCDKTRGGKGANSATDLNDASRADD